MTKKMEDKRSLSSWRNHPEDYIVIREQLEMTSGQMAFGFHVVDVVQRMSHIIDDRPRLQALVEEMTSNGVRVVTMDEAMKILYPNRP